MPIHFLGGFWVGIFFLWFFSIVRLPFFRRSIRDLNWRTILQAFLFILLVGVAYEAGEFLTNNYIGLDPFNILDTLSDLFFDLAGGSFAIFYFLKKIMYASESRVQ